MNKWIVSSMWALLGKTPRYSITIDTVRIFGCVTVETYTVYDHEKDKDVHVGQILPKSAIDFIKQREPMNPWLF